MPSAQPQYRKLLSRVLPRPIKTEREYDRIMAAILIENYDREHHPIDRTAPHEMLAYLMEQRNLKPRDLWAVLESKSRVPEILSGKRAISRAQAKKLAEFFRVSAELFL